MKGLKLRLSDLLMVIWLVMCQSDVCRTQVFSTLLPPSPSCCKLLGLNVAPLSPVPESESGSL